MRISILNKEFEFDREEDNFENIIYTIFKEASKHNRFVDYLIIDGVPVKSNFIEYLEEHFDKIKDIKVVALSVKSSIDISLIGFNDFVNEQLLSIDYLIDSLQSELSQEALSQIELILEGIAIITFQYEKIDKMGNLDNFISNYFLWNRLAAEILNLADLALAIEQTSNSGDNLKLVSLLEENLKPILLNMNEILNKMIKESENKKNF